MPNQAAVQGHARIPFEDAAAPSEGLESRCREHSLIKEHCRDAAGVDKKSGKLATLACEPEHSLRSMQGSRQSYAAPCRSGRPNREEEGIA